MKSKLPIINSILIFALLIAIAALFIQNKSLEKSIVGMKVSHVMPTSVEETNMTTILTFIAVGFALFSFLTFQGVYSFVNSETIKMKEEYAKANRRQKRYKNHLKNLEKNLKLQQAMLYNSQATIFMQDNRIDEYILTALFAAESYCEHIYENGRLHPLTTNGYKNGVKIILRSVETALHSQGKRLETNWSKKRVIELEHNISKVMDEDDYSILTKIISQLDLIVVPGA